MKRIAALILALVMALSLMACGGGNSGSGDSSGGSDESIASSTSAGSVTMEDLYGEWVRESNGWPMTISEGEVKIQTGKGVSETRLNYRVEDGKFTDGYETTYNIIVVNGEVVKLEGSSNSYIPLELSRTEVAFGDTFKDDAIGEVTITEIAGYPDKLDAGTYEPITSGNGMVVDGMVFMEIHYTVKNLSKDTLDITDNVQFTVVYGDGYQFSTEGDKYCYYREVGTTAKRIHCGSGGSIGSKMVLSPLTEKEYIVYLPVAEVLATDTETPMSINITLESEEPFSYTYGSVKVR